MYLIDVIPISRGIGVESLSYFSKDSVKAGSLIHVPLRKKEVPALVLGSRKAEASKASLKSSEYALRKIKNAAPQEFLSTAFIRAAEATAQHHASTLGAVLYTLLPQAILEYAPGYTKLKKEYTPREFVKYKMVIQTPREDRYSDYRSLIREEFASDSSIFFCVPTIAEAEYAYQELSKGVEQYTILLHSSLTKREQRSRFLAATAQQHPVLIITTPTFLSIPRPDISTIVIEHEHTESWRSQSRPYIDLRFFAEAYAEALNARIIFGDTVLRSETLWRHKEELLDEFQTVAGRITSGAQTTIVDMTETIQDTPGTVPLLSSELRTLIEENETDNSHLFLYSARRGLAPVVACADCGNLVRDPITNAPMGLYLIEKNGKEERWFISNSSGHKEPAYDACKLCGSWRLKERGIGIQSVAEELEELIDPKKLFILDRETIKTHKQALKSVREFYETPGSILLGTALAIPYLSGSVARSAVVTADSLLSLPKWRIEEDMFATLISIRELTQEHFLIQTRRASNSIFNYVARGNIADFYGEEIATRQAFGYPPFGVLIKITVQGTKDRVQRTMNDIKELFKKDAIEIYTPPIFPRGSYTLHGLIKVPRNQWPNEEMYQKLLSLPPSVAIVIDPEHIL